MSGIEDQVMSMGPAGIIALGAIGYWMANAFVYLGLAGSSKDKLEKIGEPLDSAARDMNQYSQIERHLSEDGLVELERRRAAYNELEKKLGPDIEALSRKVDARFLRILFTPILAPLVEKIKAYGATENESSE